MRDRARGELEVDERHVGRPGITQLRPIADTETGFSPSQYRRIEKSCGPRSQTTLTSFWCRPRLTRLIEMKYGIPIFSS